MYLSVTCAEDVPFTDQAEAERLNAVNPFGNYRVSQQTRACSLWPQGEIPAGYHDPVSSNIPVLIISGKKDPVTPPRRGDEVAKICRTAAPSHHRPQAGHGMNGLSDPGCVDRLIIELMDKGDGRDLDTTCIEQMTAPPFATTDTK
jgi:pimeloyl-ACP methyl ester carboxylesterase